MVFSKKQKTRCKSKKQPHWKELALLLSKKRQPNVVLRKEIIPLTKTVTTSGDSEQADLCDSELHNKNPCSEVLVPEAVDIIQNKQEFDTPEPTSGLPLENHDRAAISGVLSSANPPSEFKVKVIPTTSNNKNETINVAINDFNTLLEAETKRSDIRLSIENTCSNLNSRDGHTKFEYIDSEPNDIQSTHFEPNNIVMIAMNDKIKERIQKRSFKKPMLQSRKKCKKPNQLVLQNTNKESTEVNENQGQENNLPSKALLTSSINERKTEGRSLVPEKRILRRRLQKKYEIQDELLENHFEQNQEHLINTEMKKGIKGRPAKRKVNKNKKQNKEHGMQDPPKENAKDNSFIVNKRSRGRVFKSSTQDKYTIQNSHGIENEQVDIPSESNIDLKNTCNVDEIPDNEMVELVCHATESYKESVFGAEKNETTREPISIAHELQLLRRSIIRVTESQKHIQDALQSTRNDRFELFGKTIAACLRDLPHFESQSLEVKLMDVLLEEKRNIMMSLTNESIYYSNGCNNRQ